MSDRLFERAVREWLDDGSDRTPRHAIDGVLLAIKTTPQQRDLPIPWRFPTMNPIPRLATVAAIAAVAIAGSLYLFGRGSPVGGSPTAPPTAKPTPTPVMAGPLRAGTYVGPTIQVADIIATVNADSKLSAADRNRVLDVLCDCRDKTTWTDSIEFRGGQMIERQTVDGVTAIGSAGRYEFPDDHTLVYTETRNGVDLPDPWTLAITVDGNSFTLRRTTPVANPADDFVTRLIFESGPFTLRD
jgi:hypothetical protein